MCTLTPSCPISSFWEETKAKEFHKRYDGYHVTKNLGVGGLEVGDDIKIGFPKPSSIECLKQYF